MAKNRKTPNIPATPGAYSPAKGNKPALILQPPKQKATKKAAPKRVAESNVEEGRRPGEKSLGQVVSGGLFKLGAGLVGSGLSAYLGDPMFRQLVPQIGDEFLNFMQEKLWEEEYKHFQQTVVPKYQQMFSQLLEDFNWRTTEVPLSDVATAPEQTVEEEIMPLPSTPSEAVMKEGKEGEQKKTKTSTKKEAQVTAKRTVRARVMPSNTVTGLPMKTPDGRIVYIPSTDESRYEAALNDAYSDMIAGLHQITTSFLTEIATFNNPRITEIGTNILKSIAATAQAQAQAPMYGLGIAAERAGIEHTRAVAEAQRASAAESQERTQTMRMENEVISSIPLQERIETYRRSIEAKIGLTEAQAYNQRKSADANYLRAKAEIEGAKGGKTSGILGEKDIFKKSPIWLSMNKILDNTDLSQPGALPNAIRQMEAQFSAYAKEDKNYDGLVNEQYQNIESAVRNNLRFLGKEAAIDNEKARLLAHNTTKVVLMMKALQQKYPQVPREELEFLVMQSVPEVYWNSAVVPPALLDPTYIALYATGQLEGDLSSYRNPEVSDMEILEILRNPGLATSSAPSEPGEPTAANVGESALNLPPPTRTGTSQKVEQEIQTSDVAQLLDNNLPDVDIILDIAPDDIRIQFPDKEAQNIIEKQQAYVRTIEKVADLEQDIESNGYMLKYNPSTKRKRKSSSGLNSLLGGINLGDIDTSALQVIDSRTGEPVEELPSDIHKKIKELTKLIRNLEKITNVLSRAQEELVIENGGR